MTDEHTKGTITDVKGKVEEAAGKLTGNEEQRCHREAKQVQGEAQKGLGDVQDKAQDTLGDVADATKDTLGDVQDKAQDTLEDVKDAVGGLGR